MPERSSASRLLPQGLAGDDQPLNFRCALVDPRDAGVARVTLDRIVPDVAGPAVELDRRVGGAMRRFRGEQLRHRGRLGEGPPLVLEVGRLENEEARRFDIDLAVGDHPLHALKVGDGLPELPALLDVGLGRVHGGAGDPERERGDADAPPASSPTAIRKPSFSRPRRASPGTRQPSKRTALAAEPVWPIFFSALPMTRPGASRSTRKQEMPFPFGASGSVTAQTTNNPAYSALVM